jgi:signal transduction histidine kinase
MAFNLITLQRLTPDEVPLQSKLNEALVRELLQRTKSAAVALLLTVWLLWVLVGSSTGGMVAGLFLALIGLTVVRLVGSIWLERLPRERFHHMRAFAWFAMMSALVGMTLGAIALASYPHISPLAVALCSVAMFGINSGALVSLSASPLVYLLYVGTNMGAVTYSAFVDPLPGQEHAFQLMQVVYSSAVILLLRTVHRSFRSNVSVRLRLAASLDELRDTQARLVEASRQAGRADVAAEVLHSVGNALNSVNVSAALVGEALAKSRTQNLPKVVAMLLEHRDDFGRFLRDDPRGQKLPDYFAQLAEVVEHENRCARDELAVLTRNVDRVKVIVDALQAQTRRGGELIESFAVDALIADALQISAASYRDQAIVVVRRFDDLPPARLDRHKALQILIVLLANARDAVSVNRTDDRRITVHARRGTEGELEIAVEDNGCGIEPQHLERIFSLGFTTKERGHGMGLHFSACAARELKGRLTAHSEGKGSGASFLLALPFGAAAPG